MKVLVLGAGIAGVTVSYFLARQGHEVTVIDREPDNSMECSFANGGQLSYAHAEPWANPESLKKAIKWLGKEDAPLLLKFRMDFAMWSWIWKFILCCTEKRVRFGTANTLRLAMYSKEVLHELMQETQIEFNHHKNGILHIFRNKKNYQKALDMADYEAQLGMPYRRLKPEECVDLEPALTHVAKDLTCGVYYDGDETGDIHIFTEELEEICKKTGSGVKFLYNTEIKELHKKEHRITGVETSAGMMEADAYVVALGAYSSIFLKKLGIGLPIYPMKGYSISIPVGEGNEAPVVGLTDQSEKIVYSRLGDVLRVAGTAEFAGYDHSINKRRTENLKKLALELFPHCGDVEKVTEWACLRPSTPDGCATIGRTMIENLFLNTGHGTLGWTLGAGSAKIVAGLVDGIEPDIDLTGLTIDRYM